MTSEKGAPLMEIIPSSVSQPGTFDSQPFTITGHRLNGQNYLQWSQSVLIFVSGKGKDEHLTGEIVQPEKEDKAYRAWKTENNQVMSWLLNSMTNEIGENFLLYETAAEIWEAAKEAYSHRENTFELFDIECLLHDQRQGDLTVTQYFSILNRHWQQLDVFEEHKWKCSDDALYYKRLVEQKRVYKFLIGLNRNLDDVRGRILSKWPIPSLRETFAEVRHEESHMKVMMGTNNPEATALAVRGGQSPFNIGKQRKDRPKCNHCHKLGHTKDKCWDLHGRPEEKQFNNRRDSRGNSTTSEKKLDSPGTSLFSKEQLELLQQLFGQQKSTSSSSTIAVGSVAHKGYEYGEDDWQC